MQKQARKFKEKENTADHFIRSKGFSIDYLTTLSIRGDVSTTSIKLLKDEVDEFAIFNNGYIIFIYIKT
jgi:hypothetical protein